MELTVTEAAERLGVSGARVRKLLESGVLAGRKVNTRLWLVSPDSVEQRKKAEVRGGRPKKPEKISGGNGNK